jgi:hypothetical protein
MTLEQRESALEKEVAELKRQLDDRPQYLQIPLSIVKFEDPYYDMQRVHTKDLNNLVALLENDLKEKLMVFISFDHRCQQVMHRKYTIRK